MHIDDVVDALIALARSAGFAIYNVAGGSNVGNAALFERLGAASGCELVARHNHQAPALPRVSVARMAEAFGWRPGNTLDRAGRNIEQECACSSS